MRNRYRYDVLGAVAGVGLPLVATVIEAVMQGHGLGPRALWDAARGQPLIWIMCTTPFVLGGLGRIIVRQHRAIVRQAQEIVRLEQARRESFERTASELFGAAQGLLGNVSAFTSTTAETAASVRQTTATMNQLSQTAASAALTAETVIGLALQSERASTVGLEHAENSRAELLRLAEDVGALAHRIEGLNVRVRGVFEIASLVAGVAERFARLAAEADRAAERTGPDGGLFREVAAEVRRHADEAQQAADQVQQILADVHHAMLGAMSAAEVGSQRAKAGARVVDQTGETIRNLAAALRESSRAAKEIARVAQQQENGIEQVLKAMNEIHIATEGTVASTHQVAAEARSLNELATSLRAAVKPARS